MQRLFTSVSTIVLVLLVAVSIFGQEKNEHGEAILSGGVMKQIVQSVLRDEFKAGPKSRTVYIAERNIRREWLPKIRNIKFVVVPDEEMIRPTRKVHLFKSPERFAKGLYDMRFGHGDFCSAGGSIRRFRISGRHVESVRYSGGWGSGCGGT